MDLGDTAPGSSGSIYKPECLTRKSGIGLHSATAKTVETADDAVVIAAVVEAVGVVPKVAPAELPQNVESSYQTSPSR